MEPSDEAIAPVNHCRTPARPSIEAEEGLIAETC